MRTEWQEYAGRLKEVLELQGSPVAVTYLMEAPSSASAKRCRVCNAMLEARSGETIDITPGSSACPGGTWYLGLGDPPKGEESKGLKEFLINGEKLFCSLATLFRHQVITSAIPKGLADHVIFAPLEKADRTPDLALFICNAEQACRLVTLHIYCTGLPPKVQMAGATCYQAVTYPLASGEMNVSLMDYTSRRIRGFKTSDLLVTVPYYKMHGIIRSIPHCTAGTAKMEVPASFRHSLEAADLKELGLEEE